MKYIKGGCWKITGGSDYESVLLHLYRYDNGEFMIVISIVGTLFSTLILAHDLEGGDLDEKKAWVFAKIYLKELERTLQIILEFSEYTY